LKLLKADRLPPKIERQHYAKRRTDATKIAY